MAKTNLHQYLVETLRSEIQQQYSPGDQLPSDRTLAQRFNVSNVTIRNAMTTLAQESLVVRQVGKGTHVLDTRLLKHVGLLLQGTIFDPNASTFSLTAIRHVIGRLMQEQIPYRIYMTQQRFDGVLAPPTVGADFLQAINKDKLRGLLVIGTGPSPIWSEALAQKNIPVVGISNGDYEYRVHQDTTAIIHRAVQYLVGNGRRKIAYMGWDSQIIACKKSNIPDQRLNDFLDACRRAGIKPFKGWIQSYVRPEHPGEGWEAFRAIWAAKRQTHPDGMVVVDDLIFRDACIAISNMRLSIPDELMIVTHSNRYSGLVAPFPVARMENDPSESAEYACRMLLALLAGEKPQEKTIIVKPVWRDEILLSPDALKVENSYQGQGNWVCD